MSGNAPAEGARVNRRLSTGQYRTIDLSIFALMLAFFETVVVFAARTWFPGEPYAISVVPVVAAIVMIRWGWWAALHAALGGVVTCLASGGSMLQMVVYALGNLASLGAMTMIKSLGAQRISESSLLTLAFGACVTVLMQAGRAVVSLVMGTAPGTSLRFFTTDVITLLFTLTVLWIVRRLDGVFEDQRHYLSRIHEEQERERGGVQ